MQAEIQSKTEVDLYLLKRKITTFIVVQIVSWKMTMLLQWSEYRAGNITAPWKSLLCGCCFRGDVTQGISLWTLRFYSCKTMFLNKRAKILWILLDQPDEWLRQASWVFGREADTVQLSSRRNKSLDKLFSSLFTNRKSKWTFCRH